MYLNTHSYFSFKYGVMSTNELLAEAQSKAVNAFVLTDINSTAGCMRFIRDAHKFNVRPIVGVDCRNGIKQQFVAIAQNNEGFQELNIYLSKHLHEGLSFPNSAPPFKNIYIIYPFDSSPTLPLKPNEFIGIDPSQILKLPFSKWKNHIRKMVLLRPVTFRKEKLKSDYNLHKLLRAIANNTLHTKLNPDDLDSHENYMLKEGDLLNLFKSYPDIIDNTLHIINTSNIHFEFGSQYPHKNIQTYTSTHKEDYDLLRIKCLKGLRYRYPKPNIKIYRRLALELNLIQQQGFVSYFLVNWDIINFALSKNYFYIGRGSGANSIVAYLLRITDVDPIELDLYFERFMNLYRKNPPDFDIDFSWRDREDITKYIFERFGYDHTALIATYSTFQFKAAVREVGKACGLPPHEITPLTLLEPDDLESAIANIKQTEKAILNYARKLKGIPSHLSVHASGILISHLPIYHFTATSLPPKGFPVTHFDMTEAEDAGLYKFDILSQRGLSKIKQTLQIIKYNQPNAPNIDIHDTKKFFEDEKIKHLLRTGQTIGCFYVESPAMRMLLKKLGADNYLGLVAASSIIRPGVAKSGMMREYILRFKIPERRKEAHPILAALMPETFGIMVYQEDVIKVAHYFAGLSLAESDQLRRGMSGKYRSRIEFQEVERRYFEECKKKGHEDKLTKEVWHQIMSFAGYAFAKGHSASYAIESYQCLYLKAHYPLEYLVSIINNGGGFYRLELYIQEARLQGAIIENPCINRSQYETIIIGNSIFLGFHMISKIDPTTIKNILEGREYYQQYKSLEEVIKILSESKEQIETLIRGDVMRTIHNDKKALLWKLLIIITTSKHHSNTLSLFNTKTKKYILPSFYHDTREDGFDQMEIFGFPLINPFLLTHPYKKAYIIAKEMTNYKNSTVTLLGYLVATKYTRTTNRKRMCFGTFIDQKGSFIDTVHFPTISIEHPIRGRGVYEIIGRVVDEFDFLSIEVSSLKKVHYLNMEDELNLLNSRSGESKILSLSH